MGGWPATPRMPSVPKNCLDKIQGSYKEEWSLTLIVIPKVSGNVLNHDNSSSPIWIKQAWD
jgi:hypothetical protein